MANLTVANTNYLLKTLWPQERVENLVYADNPLLAMIPKDKTFYGENMYIATRYADSAGGSGTFATAQANKAPHKGVRFLLVRGKDYQLFGIENEAILAAKRDKGALIRSLDTEIESAMNNITRSLAIALYGDAAGVRGQINATGPVAGPPALFTLLNINDITNVEVGMTLVASASRTGALRATPASAVVTAVDRDLGTVTFANGTFAGTNWAASDFVFRQGDAANGSTTILPTGLLGWLPTTAPAAASSFFGIDRSIDTVRLAGLRIDVSALNPEEGLVTAFSRIAREGGRSSHLFVNPIDYRNIAIALGSKVVTEYVSVGQIGFETLRVTGPRGVVRIVADQNAPGARAFALDMRSWKFYSLEEAPMMIEADDLRILRDSTTDSFEGRIAYYGNLACTAPGWNGNLTMPS